MVEVAKRSSMQQLLLMVSSQLVNYSLCIACGLTRQPETEAIPSFCSELVNLTSSGGLEIINRIWILHDEMQTNYRCSYPYFAIFVAAFSARRWIFAVLTRQVQVKRGSSFSCCTPVSYSCPFCASDVVHQKFTEDQTQPFSNQPYSLYGRDPVLSGCSPFTIVIKRCQPEFHFTKAHRRSKSNPTVPPA